MQKCHTRRWNSSRAVTSADAMAWSTWRILNGLTGELTCELEAKDPTISQLKKSIEKEINIHPARQQKEEYIIWRYLGLKFGAFDSRRLVGWHDGGVVWRDIQLCILNHFVSSRIFFGPCCVFLQAEHPPMRTADERQRGTKKCSNDLYKCTIPRTLSYDELSHPVSWDVQRNMYQFLANHSNVKTWLASCFARHKCKDTIQTYYGRDPRKLNTPASKQVATNLYKFGPAREGTMPGKPQIQLMISPCVSVSKDQHANSLSPKLQGLGMKVFRWTVVERMQWNLQNYWGIY